MSWLTLIAGLVPFAAAWFWIGYLAGYDRGRTHQGEHTTPPPTRREE